jgi:hypothetical protein
MPVRTKTLHRGLFKRVRWEADFNTTSAEELMAMFEDQKYGKELVDDSLEILRAAARRALRDAGLPETTDSYDGLEGNAALGAEVLSHIRLLEGHRRHGRIEEAIHETMKAVERWMELRANVFFEKLVRARQKQLMALPAKKTVSDAQIRAQLRKHTQSDAAAALGITDRQIRSRLSLKERRALATERKRKSVRVPPR